MRRELKFEGNDITSLNKEISIRFGDWEEGNNPNDIPNYVIGSYRGKPVYKIKDVLYMLEDSSWVFNSEYHWYLKEVTEKCYKYFECN